MAGGVIRMGINLLLVPLLIRALGVEDYGLWVVVVALLGLAGLMEGGVALTTTVFGAKYLGNGDTDRLAKTFTIGVTISFVLASLAGSLVFYNNGEVSRFFPLLLPDRVQSITQTLRLGGLLVFLRIFQQNLVGLQQAYQKYASLNILETTQIIFTNLGILAIAYRGGRIFEMVQWQIAIGSLILICHVWNSFRLTSADKLSLQWDGQMLKEFLHFSGMSWLLSIGGNLFSQADKLIVGSVLGTNVVALYSVITSISYQINTLSALPAQPMVPTISGLLNQENVDRNVLKDQIQRGFLLSVLVAMAVGVILMTLAPLIMQILVPSHTQTDVYALQLAIVIYVSYSINAIGYYILIGANAIATCTGIQAIGAVLTLIMIRFGSDSFGLIGAVAGNAAYSISLFMTIFGMRLLKISWQEWTGWAKVPLLWFISCGLIAVTVPNDFGLRITVAIAQAGIFLYLLMKSQKIGLDFKDKKLSIVRY